ncbi:hypothetical protein [Undibacterium oligocarboniphilum]|nr:hypothetical protein [Undibacterium oligocarboniphilum]
MDKGRWEMLQQTIFSGAAVARIAGGCGFLNAVLLNAFLLGVFLLYAFLLYVFLLHNQADVFMRSFLP